MYNRPTVICILLYCRTLNMRKKSLNGVYDDPRTVSSSTACFWILGANYTAINGVTMTFSTHRSRRRHLVGHAPCISATSSTERCLPDVVVGPATRSAEYLGIEEFSTG